MIENVRRAIDNGKDAVQHVDQLLERTQAQMTAKTGKQKSDCRSGKFGIVGAKEVGIDEPKNVKAC
jgi:hypothetical protein